MSTNTPNISNISNAEEIQLRANLAKEWVNILSITPLPLTLPTSAPTSVPFPTIYAVSIEYTVPPDPLFKQSNYKTATRWVKDTVIVSSLDYEAIYGEVWSAVSAVRELLSRPSIPSTSTHSLTHRG